MPNPQFTKPWHGVPHESIMLRQVARALDGRGVSKERLHMDSFGV